MTVKENCMSRLFTPLQLRGIKCRNRIFVSPMCQYSSRSGEPTAWHLVHLGSRAVGGAGLVMVEATAVAPEGRISPDDSGLWNDSQAEAYAPIVDFVRQQGAVAAIQLAHAGRKASTNAPWRHGEPLSPEAGGWTPAAPSAVPFAPSHAVPHELAEAELDIVVEQFAASARRAQRAGFQVVEVHLAHGYLLHEFLSPLANKRTDDYGGNLEGRMRFPMRVVEAVRAVWPEELPLFVRISSRDWAPGGWDLSQSIELSRRLRAVGVDFIDCSAGGLLPDEPIPVGPGFQVPFSAAIRTQVGIATGAVGCITAPVQAEQIVANGEADAVLLARELLRDPYWPLHAARELGVDVDWPPQYLRAKR